MQNPKLVTKSWKMSLNAKSLGVRDVCTRDPVYSFVVWWNKFFFICKSEYTIKCCRAPNFPNRKCKLIRRKLFPRFTNSVDFMFVIFAVRTFGSICISWNKTANIRSWTYRRTGTSLIHFLAPSYKVVLNRYFSSDVSPSILKNFSWGIAVGKYRTTLRPTVSELKS